MHLILLRETDLNLSNLAAFMWAVDGDFVPPLSERLDLDAYARKLFETAVNIIAIRDRETLIQGVVSFYCDPAHYDGAHLSFLAVGPELREQGWARALMLRCSDYVGQAGMSSIRTRTWRGNGPMIRLLEGLGYEFEEEKVDAQGRPSIHYRLKLPVCADRQYRQ